MQVLFCFKPSPLLFIDLFLHNTVLHIQNLLSTQSVLILQVFFFFSTL